jgi:hypothetical protein
MGGYEEVVASVSVPANTVQRPTRFAVLQGAVEYTALLNCEQAYWTIEDE